MNTEHCRNVIIGSGEGGKYLAWHLAQSGEPTTVIERKYVGGSCPKASQGSPSSFLSNCPTRTPN